MWQNTQLPQKGLGNTPECRALPGEGGQLKGREGEGSGLAAWGKRGTTVLV